MAKSFLQKIGFKKSRGRPSSKRKTQIVFDIPSGFKQKKEKPVTLTKRQKKIALANVEGAGAGFVIGTALGGFGGMVVGVPAGVIAGNIIGKRRAGKRVGRPLKYKQKGILNRLLSTRQERVHYSREMQKKKRK